ncbi:hypothetical protein PG996_004525 [Apiospora saccharicola]|uniref:Carrier domain-containing protein n=1 Tax=Apiospora saccharicola TaxID=335842 RepID=A0ABR1W4D2_9PEZI
MPYDPAGMTDAAIVSHVAACLVAMAVCDPLFTGDTLVAETKGLNFVHLYSDAAADNTKPAVQQLPPYLSGAEAKQLLPRAVRAFVGFANDGGGGVHPTSTNEQTLRRVLPRHVRITTAETLFSVEASPSTSSPSGQQTLRDRLQRAIHYTQDGVSRNRAAGIIIRSAILHDYRMERNHRQAPCSGFQTRFRIGVKGDKTYWLVGLSGALGISLCDWMIGHGARHMVITSRNPQIAHEWIANHERNGVKVAIIPCDVTDEPRLRSVHKTICTTHPPILGVFHGAMVLRDVSILNMSHEQFTAATRPKVLGSVHLDRLFGHGHGHDEQAPAPPLDFFLLLSSMNCVVGTRGQANYAAANMFLCALAANRRARRGLAACALNLGTVMGVGYMEREASNNKALELTMREANLMPLSETDFHQIFAAGVEVGRPSGDDAAATANDDDDDDDYGPVISTGLLEVKAADDAQVRPRWSEDPKFLHFVNKHQTVVGAGEEKKKPKQTTSSVSIAERLGECKTEEQLLHVIQDLMGMRSNDIGLDSLIAVDVRSWFLKHFHVSIPVLKIMVHDTMANLAKYASKEVPAELTSQLAVTTEEAHGGGGSSDSSKSILTPWSDDDGPIARNGMPGRHDSLTDSTVVESSVPTTEEALSTNASSSTDEGDVHLDYHAECELPPDFEALAQAQGDDDGPPSSPESPPETILLTGVTGLLGRHLLHYLLSEATANNAKRIICIAVRRLPRRLAARQLPLDDERVSYFAGDRRFRSCRCRPPRRRRHVAREVLPGPPGGQRELDALARAALAAAPDSAALRVLGHRVAGIIAPAG